MKPLEARKITSDDPWDDDAGRRVFVEEDKQVEVMHLAGGLIALNTLKYNVTQSLRGLSADVLQNAKAVFILIEEPENHLHPEFQKSIPRLINIMIRELIEERFRAKIAFCISTHSPFVISAVSRYPNQKVYLFENGSLVDLGQRPIQSSVGYRGHACSAIVGQMLGADVTDLGYPENYAILEEPSMQVILEDAKEKGLIRNFQFVSASGIGNVPKMSDTINQMRNLNTLLKCNPFYVDKYLVIADSLIETNEKESKKLEGMRKNLGPRFIQLRNSALEEYYKNIDPQVFEASQKEIAAADRHMKGLVKATFAEQIAQKIRTREDFSKLFSGELDLLLH